MTYQETLDYMFAQLPMYQRIGAAAYKADMQPTLDLMEALGHPERKFKSIHVAGTNGKGSVSHFMASILQEAGYKVGLYTSPHLVDFRERIRVGGEMIPEQEVVRFHSSFLIPHSSLQLSFFEMTVGLAFDYFAREKVDVAVVEVGMGGRLDSTNVVVPELSIITNIGLDHTQFLGDTLEKIAGEKAGIIKERVPVVIGETQAETRPVFERVAEEHHAPITFADQHYLVDEELGIRNEVLGTYRVHSLLTPHFSLLIQSQLTGAYQRKNLATVLQAVDVLRENSSLITPHSSLLIQSQLTGAYQRKNLATVLQAVDVLRENSSFLIPHSSLQRGLARVVDNTHLRGRWEKIGERPLTICETAHNADGIEAMMQSLQRVDFKRLHIIYGCVNDKDFRKILHLLHSSLPTPHSSLTWRFSQPSVPRGLPVGDLQAAAREMGIEGEAFSNVKDAMADARAAADEGDLVLITGSIFLIADALSAYNVG